LDPSTRNSIWGLLNSFSTVDRAIVISKFHRAPLDMCLLGVPSNHCFLTVAATHMMVEADSLCNRIAIMSEGKLKVVATQQRLKDRFGSGYLLQLNLVNSTEQGTTDALAFVRENVHPGAILQTKQAKTLHIALPRDLDLRQVFTALYSKKSAAAGGINQFLLSQSSLEDVFLALGD
jgi:ABC-type multidrug transport system ATPase subunit